MEITDDLDKYSFAGVEGQNGSRDNGWDEARTVCRGYRMVRFS